MMGRGVRSQGDEDTLILLTYWLLVSRQPYNVSGSRRLIVQCAPACTQRDWSRSLGVAPPVADHDHNNNNNEADDNEDKVNMTQ